MQQNFTVNNTRHMSQHWQCFLTRLMYFCFVYVIILPVYVPCICHTYIYYTLLYSVLAALLYQASLEDLWSQKFCLAITGDLIEERDNGDVISNDRLGFMQRRTVSCPSAGVAQCGSADDWPKHSQPESELSMRPTVQWQPLNDFREMFTLLNIRIFRIYFLPSPPSNPTQKTN